MSDGFILPEWLAVVLAPIIGSFLSVIIVRLPEGESMAFSRSRCRHCQQALTVIDLIPLISWLLQRGRCRHCGTAMGVLYPAVEIAATVIALWAAAATEGFVLWASCVLGWMLLAIAWIDWCHFIIPDSLSLPVMLAGLLVTTVTAPERLADHALGAAAGFAAFAAIAWLYRCWRGRDGLGLGDAKLLAAAGAWVSWLGLPGVVLIASGLGIAGALALAWSDRPLGASTKVAFGPFLCVGMWVVWLHGPVVLG
jgi:leader peptidase (prepilin peptidase)/N-methyltransferase